MLAYHWTSADKVFKLTNHLEYDFFAHYVFPFETQRSATISLKTYGSKIKCKPCSKKTAEVIKMINSSWFKKGHESYNKVKFSTEVVSEIIQLHKSGFFIKDIAKNFNRSPTLIKRILLENNVKLRNRSELTKMAYNARKYFPINKKRFSENEINHIISLYKLGHSKEEISEKLNCSVTPITRLLLENGIRLRNRSEVGKITIKKHPIWNKGIKGIIKAWNKGLTKEDPRVKRIAEQLLSRPVSEITRDKLSQAVKKMMTDEHKKLISQWTKKGMTEEVRKTISQKKKEWIKKNPELARKYMEPWVNSGTYGFGTYSTASDGHLCYSSLELWVDGKLTEHKLRHIIHPHIPNSTKYADFLVNDVFIEVDGMCKETEEDWNGKLEVYRKNNLKFIIINPKDDVDKIMEDIKNGKYNTAEIAATY